MITALEAARQWTVSRQYGVLRASRRDNDGHPASGALGREADPWDPTTLDPEPAGPRWSGRGFVTIENWTVATKRSRCLHLTAQGGPPAALPRMPSRGWVRAQRPCRGGARQSGGLGAERCARSRAWERTGRNKSGSSTHIPAYAGKSPREARPSKRDESHERFRMRAVEGRPSFQRSRNRGVRGAGFPRGVYGTATQAGAALLRSKPTSGSSRSRAGRVVFRGQRPFRGAFYNPLGTVHGGWISTAVRLGRWDAPCIRC